MTEQLFAPMTLPSRAAYEQASARQLQLTKPAGSLGLLEEIGSWICAAQGQCPPKPISRAKVVVFAGDHGVAAKGVSAFPAEVTAQMVSNIVQGGAAINVLADAADARVRVVDMAVNADLSVPKSVTAYKIRHGSGSIDVEDALTREETLAAIRAGIAIADEEVDAGADLLIAGEVGIGNTTVAATITSVMTGKEPVAVLGRGTGIDDDGWMRKAVAVRDARYRGYPHREDPIALLQTVGGADIAAVVGFLAQAAIRKSPVLLDGSVITAAALVAEKLASGAKDWWLATHLSIEPAHKAALDALELEPLFDLRLRLGEGTGAVAALPWVVMATKVLAEMATFAEAGVSDKQ